MTKQYFIRISLAILFSTNLFFFVSCHHSAEYADTQNLHIENGVYTVLRTPGTTGIRCAVSFEYFVTGQQCQVGGYGLTSNSLTWAVNWYKLQTLAPETRYVLSDTFSSSVELNTNPNVTMQAYKVGDSNSYPALRAQFVLLPKL